MRGLSDQFFGDLQTGLLSPLRERVLADHSLCLEIRGDAVNVYYRGGSLLRLGRRGRAYRAIFDMKYLTGTGLQIPAGFPGETVASSGDVRAWIESVPFMKMAMDLWFGLHPKEEREVQQLIVRDNNFGKMSNATDYFICDIEYANRQGRFDLVAAHWQSNGAERKRQRDCRLVLGEVKVGDSALGGKSGLHAHVRDIDAFLGAPGNLDRLKDEMVRVFNEKRSLGFVRPGRELLAFSDQKPMLLLVLVNHDPDSRKLRDVLATLPPCRYAEICVATGCFMGYGLFEPAIHTLRDTLSLFGNRICDKPHQRGLTDS